MNVNLVIIIICGIFCSTAVLAASCPADFLKALPISRTNINGIPITFQPPIGTKGARHFTAQSTLPNSFNQIFFGQPIYFFGLNALTTTTNFRSGNILPSTSFIEVDTSSVIVDITSVPCGVQTYVFEFNRNPDDCLCSDNDVIAIPAIQFKNSAAANINLPATGSILLKESFETDGEGIRYDMVAAFYGDDDDAFIRTNNNEIPRDDTGNHLFNVNNKDGAYFIASVNSNRNYAPSRIIFKKVSITDISTIQLSIKVGGNRGDSDDFLRVTYSVDGAPSVLVVQYAPTGVNTPFRLDANGDGVGDTAPNLSNNLLQFTSQNIAVSGSTMTIEIIAHASAVSDNLYFDDVVVVGIKSNENQIIMEHTVENIATSVTFPLFVANAGITGLQYSMVDTIENICGSNAITKIITAPFTKQLKVGINVINFEIKTLQCKSIIWTFKVIRLAENNCLLSAAPLLGFYSMFTTISALPEKFPFSLNRPLDPPQAGNEYTLTSISGTEIPNNIKTIEAFLELSTGTTATITTEQDVLFGKAKQTPAADGFFTISNLIPGKNVIIIDTKKPGCLDRQYKFVITKANNIICSAPMLKTLNYFFAEAKSATLVSVQNVTSPHVVLSAPKGGFSYRQVTFGYSPNLLFETNVGSFISIQKTSNPVITVPIPAVFATVDYFRNTTLTYNYKFPFCKQAQYTQEIKSWQSTDPFAKSYCNNNTILDTITIRRDAAGGTIIPTSIRQFGISSPTLPNAVGSLVITAVSSKLLASTGIKTIQNVVPTIAVTLNGKTIVETLPITLPIVSGRNEFIITAFTSNCGPATYTYMVNKELDTSLCLFTEDIISNIVVRKFSDNSQAILSPALSVTGTRSTGVAPSLENIEHTMLVGPITVKPGVTGVAVTELSSAQTFPLNAQTQVPLLPGNNVLRLVVTSINCAAQTYTISAFRQRNMNCGKSNLISSIDIKNGDTLIKFVPPLPTINNEQRETLAVISNAVSKISFFPPAFKSKNNVPTNARVALLDSFGSSIEFTTIPAIVSVLVGDNTFRVVTTSTECSPFTYTVKVVREEDKLRCGSTDLLTSVRITNSVGVAKPLALTPAFSTTGARLFTITKELPSFEPKVIFSQFLFSNSPNFGTIKGVLSRVRDVHPFPVAILDNNVSGAAVDGILRSGRSNFFKLVVSSEFCVPQTYTFNITKGNQNRCNELPNKDQVADVTFNNFVFDFALLKNRVANISVPNAIAQTIPTLRVIPNIAVVGPTIRLFPGIAVETKVNVNPDPLCDGAQQQYIFSITRATVPQCGTNSDVLAGVAVTSNIFPPFAPGSRVTTALDQDPNFPATVRFSVPILNAGFTILNNGYTLTSQIDNGFISYKTYTNTVQPSVRSFGKNVVYTLTVRTAQCKPQTYTFKFSRKPHLPCTQISNNILQTISLTEPSGFNFGAAIGTIGSSRTIAAPDVPNKFNRNIFTISNQLALAITSNTNNGQITDITGTVIDSFIPLTTVLNEGTPEEDIPGNIFLELGDNKYIIRIFSRQCETQTYTLTAKRLEEPKLGYICGDNADVLNSITFGGVTGVVPPLVAGVRQYTIPDQANDISQIQLNGISKPANFFTYSIMPLLKLNNGNNVDISVAGNLPATIPLQVGDNKILLTVFSELCPTQTYTYNVKRATLAAICGATNDVLTALPITVPAGGAITFTQNLPAARTLTATSKLSNCEQFVTLGTPSLKAGLVQTFVQSNSFQDNQFRTLTGNLQVPLIVGINNVTVIVRSQQCSTQTYTFMIERQADDGRCDNSNILTTLPLKEETNVGATLSLIPSLSTTGTRAFTTTILDNSVQFLFVGQPQFSADASNAKLFYKKQDGSLDQLIGNNQIPVSIGSNVITLVATSNCPPQEYTLTVIRDSSNICGKNSDLLQQIRLEKKKNLEQIPLNRPVGEPKQREFIANLIVPNEATFTTVTFKDLLFNKGLANAKATMRLDNGDGIAMGTSTDRPVFVGDNIFKIEVTADACVCQTYTFKVKRSSEFDLCGPNNDILEAIVIQNGATTIQFTQAIGTIGVRNYIAKTPLTNAVSTISFRKNGLVFRDAQTANIYIGPPGAIKQDITVADRTANLKVGLNIISIDVIGKFCPNQTYTFSFIRSEFTSCPANFDVLSSITFTRLIGATLDGSVAFKESLSTPKTRTLTAAAELKNCVTAVRLSLPVISKATNPQYLVNGVVWNTATFNSLLDVGDNDIVLQVATADCTTQTYTFKMKRQANINICKTNSDVLSGITITTVPGNVNLFPAINLVGTRALTNAVAQPDTQTQVAVAISNANLNTANGISGHTATVNGVAIAIGGAATNSIFNVGANTFTVVVRTTQCKFQTYKFTATKNANANCATQGVLLSIAVRVTGIPAVTVTFNDASQAGNFLPGTTHSAAALQNLANGATLITAGQRQNRAFATLLAVTYTKRDNVVVAVPAAGFAANTDNTQVGVPSADIFKVVATSVNCAPQTYSFQYGRQANGVCGNNNIISAIQVVGKKNGVVTQNPLSFTTAFVATAREFTVKDVDAQIDQIGISVITPLAGTAFTSINYVPTSGAATSMLPVTKFINLALGDNKLKFVVISNICAVQTYTINVKRVPGPSSVCTLNLLEKLVVRSQLKGGGAFTTVAINPNPIANNTRLLTSSAIPNNQATIQLAATETRIGATVTVALPGVGNLPQTVRMDPIQQNFTLVANSPICSSQTYTYSISKATNPICGNNDVLTALQLRAQPSSSVIEFEPALSKVGARTFFVKEQTNDVTSIQFEATRTFIPAVTGGTLRNAANVQTAAAFRVNLPVGQTTFVTVAKTDQCIPQTYTFIMSRESSVVHCGAFNDLLLQINIEAPAGIALTFAPSLRNPSQRLINATKTIENKHSIVTFKTGVVTLPSATNAQVSVVDPDPTKAANTLLTLNVDRNLPLYVGKNEYKIIVSANQCATQTYTLRVSRAAAGTICGANDDLIKTLVVKANSNSGALVTLSDVGTAGARTFKATKPLANSVSKLFFSDITFTILTANAFFLDSGLVVKSNSVDLTPGENVITFQARSNECPLQVYTVIVTRQPLESVCGKFNTILEQLPVRVGSSAGDLISFVPFVGAANARLFVAELALPANTKALFFGNPEFRAGIGTPTAKIIGTDEILPEPFEIASGGNRDIKIVVRSNLCPTITYTFRASRQHNGTGTIPGSLVISKQPGQGLINSLLQVQPIIQLSDTSGTIVKSSAFTCTVSKDSGPGNLLGNLTVNFKDGIATFTDLKFDASGRYIIEFATNAGDFEIKAQEVIICPSDSTISKTSKAGCLCNQKFKDIDARANTVSCEACTTGTFSLGGNSEIFGDSAHVCIAKCPIGYKDTNILKDFVSCVVCANNTYNDVAMDSTVATDPAAQCFTCPANSESGVASETCTCKKGFRDANSTRNRVNCFACGINQYSAGGDSVVGNDAPSICAACPSNSGAPIGSSKLADCKCNDKFGKAANGICTLCQAGSFSVTANDVCSPCVAGTFSTNGASVCTDCNNNTFSAAGATKCLPCPANKVSNAGAANCTDPKVTCNAGFGLHGNQTICVQCTANQFSAGGSVKCQACATGKISVAGAEACTDDPTFCLPGFELKGLICSPCAAGFISTGGVKVQCTACQPGFYSSSTVNCTACPINTFNTAVGRSSINSCRKCSEGEISTVGSSRCTNDPNNPQPFDDNSDPNSQSSLQVILKNKKRAVVAVVDPILANPVRVAIANCLLISTRYVGVNDIKGNVYFIVISSVPNGLSSSSLRSNAIQLIATNNICLRNTVLSGAVAVINTPSNTTPSKSSEPTAPTIPPSPAPTVPSVPIQPVPSTSTIPNTVSPIPSVPTAPPAPTTTSSSSSSTLTTSLCTTLLGILLLLFIIDC